MEDVERDEHQPARLVPDRGLQRRAIGAALLAWDDDLAVDNRSPAWQIDSQRKGPVFNRPVTAVLAVKTHAAFIDDDLRSVTVKIDLVNPSLILGRLLDPSRQLRRNELQQAATDLGTLTQ